MDEQPVRRRYNNGNTHEQTRRKDTVDWYQCLVETNMDQWDVEDRRHMQANLNWVTERRNQEAKRMLAGPARRWALGLVAAGAFVALQIFGSWLGGTAANSMHCPTGDTCTPIVSGH